MERSIRFSVGAIIVLWASIFIFSSASGQNATQTTDSTINLPNGKTRVFSTHEASVPENYEQLLIEEGKEVNLSEEGKNKIVKTFRDHLPKNWKEESGDGPLTDSYGNPIVNFTDGLPHWSQKDIDAFFIELNWHKRNTSYLRLAIKGKTDQIQLSSEDRYPISFYQKSSEELKTIIFESEYALGNFIAQAIVRDININSIISLKDKKWINNTVATSIIEYLKFYEGIKYNRAEEWNYSYEPSQYNPDVISLLKKHGSNMDEIHHSLALQDPSLVKQMQKGGPLGELNGLLVVPSGSYVKSSLSRSMSYLSGYTSLWAATTTSSWDDVYSDVPIGFNFKFYECDDGDNNSYARVSTNGYVAFYQQGGGATDGSDWTNDVINNTNDPDGYAGPWWDDLWVVYETTPDRIEYKTEGSVGNRVFTVEYYSVSSWNQGTTGEYVYFQAKLFEYTGTIEFHYGIFYDPSGVYSSTQGMEDYSGLDGDFGPNSGNTNSVQSPNNYRFRPCRAPKTVTVQANSPTLICSGGNASMQVISLVDGHCSGGYQYQWETTSGTIVQAWNSSSILNLTNQTSSGQYVCYVRCGNCNSCLVSPPSNTITISVVPNPSVVIPGSSTTVCTGGSASMNAIATGVGISYQWQYSTSSCSGPWTNTGSNSSSFNTPPLSTTTYYQVVVTTNPGSCQATSTCYTVNVVPDPTVSVSGTSNICTGGTASLSASVSGGTGTASYQWQYSTTSCSGPWTNIGSNSSSLTTPALSSTTYYQCIVTQTGSGCADVSNCHTVNVVPDPTASINGTGTICTGSSASLSVSVSGGIGSYSYQWQASSSGCSGPWSNVGSNSPNLNTGALSATTYYQCIITQAASGCQTTAPCATVTVVNGPTVSLSGGTNICNGGNATLTAAVSGATGSLNYQWQYSTNGCSGPWVNTGSNSSTLNTGTLSQTTSYQCIVTQSSGGCASTSNCETVAVVPDPTVNISGTTTICDGASTSLSVTVSGGIGTNSYQWQYSTTGCGGPWTNTGTNSSSLTTGPLSTTTYYQCVVTQSGTACQNTSACATVTVVAVPSISISGGTTICDGGNATLTASVVGATGGVSYQWQYSNTGCSGPWTNIGSNSASLNTGALSNSTYYQCIITQSVGGCTSTSNCESVTVIPDPTVTVSGTSTVCSGGTSTLSASVSGGSGTSNYQWQYSTTGCSGPWINTGVNSPSFTTSALGTTTYYQCVVTQSASGCNSTSNCFTVNVVPDPTVNISGGTTICSGTGTNLSVTVSGGSGTSSYQWQYSTTGCSGPWTNIGTNNPSLSTGNLTTTTYYQCIVTQTGSGCQTTSACETVNVVNSPIVTINGGTSICDGGNATLNASVSGSSGTLSYQWQYSTTGCSGPWTNTGINSTSLNTGPLSTTTYYQCVVTQSSGGCSGTSNCETVTVVPDPTVSINGNSNVCNGGTAIITSSQSGGLGTVSYQWQYSTTGCSGPWTNTGTNSNSLVTAPLTSTTYYQLVVTQSVSGCQSTSNCFTVNVLPDPVATISGTDTVCAGGNSILTANITGGTGTPTYTWQYSTTGCSGPWTNTGSNSNTLSSGALSTTTYYRLIVGQTGSGCSDTSSCFTLTVLPDPTVNISGTSAICSGDNTNLSVSVSGGLGTVSYQWQYSTTGCSGPWTNTGSNSTTLNTGSLSNTTYYQCIVTQTGSGCETTSGCATVTVVQPPTVNLSGSTTICQGGDADLSVTITGASGPTSTQWQASTTGCSGPWTTVASGTLTYNTGALSTTTYYQCIVTQTNGGCVVTSGCETVTVVPDHTSSITASDTIVCVNGTIDLTASVSGGTGTFTYQWQYYNGSNWVNVGSSSTTFQPNTSTTFNNRPYRVIVSASGSGCDPDTSNTINITVEPAPSITIFGTTTICSGGDATLTATASGGTGSCAYQWQFWDGSSWVNTGTNSSSYNTGALSLTTQYRCIYGCPGTGCGSSSSNIVAITVIPDPVVTVTGVNAICDGDSLILSAGISGGNGTASYQWQYSTTGCSGPWTNIGTNNPSLNTGALSATTYYQCVVSQSSSGCQAASNCHTITINPNPVANFTFSSQCDQSVDFTDASTISSGSITSWFWEFGNGGTSTQQNPSYTYLLPGSYTIQLTVTSNNGCTSTISQTVEVYTNPVANFTTNNVCDGESAVFTDVSTLAYGSITSWSWDFGDGTTSTTQSPLHLYPGPGTYLVTLVVTTSHGCSDTITKPIVIYVGPNADFSVSNVCVGQTAVFTNLSTVSSGTIIANQWYFGDNTTSILANPTKVYSQPGTYNVQLIVTSSSGCTDTITKPITVFVSPTADFQFTNACDGDTVYFSDLSNISSGAISSWSWDFGDGATSNIQNPSHLYASAGTYSVTLVVSTGSGCTDTIVNPVKVYQRPVASFTTTPACQGTPVTFTNTSTGTIINYQWFFGDGNTSVVQNPTHTYSNAGTYLVQLVITNQYGCTDTAKTNLTIFPGTAANFSFSNACFGDTVYFTDMTVGLPVAYHWDFGDGDTSNLANPAHLYVAPGTYIVTLTALTPNGCYNTVSQTVYIYDKPTAAGSVTDVCLGAASNFVNTSTGSPVMTYTWTFGDGTGSNLFQPTHAYAAAGSYTVMLIATSGNGCSDTTFMTANVLDAAQADFSFNNVCLGGNTVFNNLTTGPSTGWTWDFGDGNTSTLQNPTHAYTSAGSYSVQLITTTANGCIDSITKTVDVYANPVAAFTADSVCIGAAVNFIDASTGLISSYAWNFGDGSSSILSNPIHVYSNPGTYLVELVVTSADGCTDTAYQNVVIYPGPTADFSTGNVCFGQNVQFLDLSIGSPVSWSWNFGDGNTSTLQNPTHLYAGGGMFTVQLIVTTANGCQDSISKTVTIFPQPGANFTFSNVCLGENMDFTDASSGPITGWNWNFGDGNSSTIQNPSHLYAAAGTYTVTLIVSTANGCTDTSTQTVTVYETPLASYSYTNVCYGQPMTFINTSTGTITSYAWDFGDGTTASTANASHLYMSAGTYNVSLIVTTANACADTIVQTVEVYPQPVAIFNATNVCYGNPVVFNNSSTGPIASYLWDFGDGSSSGLAMPTHTYALPGTYTVLLTITSANGCIDTASQVIEIYPAPIAEFSYNNACLGTDVQFTDQTAGTVSSWAWDFGDGNNSTAQHPTHTYASAGTYTVSLIVSSANACNDTVTHTVEVYPQPQANFTAAAVCEGNPTVFVNASTGPITSYSWDFGDGSSSIIASPVHTYSSAGSFTTTLIVTTANGCADTLTQSVVVWPAPVADFSFNNVCLGDLVNFNDLSTGPISNYSWDFGDGNTSTLQNPTHTYSSAGSFTVSLIVSTANGCADTVQYTVEVYPQPLASFTASNVCHGSPVVFTNTSTGGATSYQWNFGDGTSSTLANPSHTYANPGTYTVVLTASTGNGCTDTYSTSVTVSPQPIADFSFTTACLGVATVFTDLTNVTVTSWSWDFGDGNSSTLQNPTNTYASAGTYTVTLIVSTANGCIDTVQKTVDVYPQPVAAFTVNNVCFGNAVNFNNTSTGPITSTFWDFGDGTSSINTSPVHYYGAPGTYTITLIVTTANGCADTITQTVTIYPSPTADFSFNNVCLGQSTDFTDLTNGLVTSWSWDFGDGNTSVLQNPSHTYVAAGTYNVTLIVSAGFGCNDTIVQQLEVYGQATAGFTAVNACLGDAVVFTNTSTGPIVSQIWYFGDGTSSIAQNPQHVYPASGSYSVILVVHTANGCNDTITQNVQVFPTPAANFAFNNVCLGDPSTFTDLSGSAATSWSWDFGDGNSSTLQSPTHTYSSAGTYNVTLIVSTSNACSDTISQNVVVYDEPVSLFTVANACFGEYAQFVNNSTGPITQYTWDFGDGSSSVNQSPQHYYNAPGTYTVTLITNTANGCTDTSTQTLEIYPAPTADFSFTNVCFGDPVSFTDLSQGAITAWSWDFGDGNSSSLQNPVHTYSTIGTYTVSLIVSTGNSCHDTISQTVMVYDQPVAGFTATTVCQGYATQFTNTSSGAISQYAWFFGDGGSSIAQNPSHTYAAPGLYNVTLVVVSGQGCSDTITQSIEVYELPVADFTFTPACFDTPVQFTDASTISTGSITSWHWDFGDGFISNQQNPIHTYAANGLYHVSLVVSSANGCIDSIDYNVFQAPALVVIPDSISNVSCNGGNNGSISLDVVGGTAPYTYLWNSTPPQNSSYAMNLTAGSYTVVVTDAIGCSDSLNVTITEPPVLLATITSTQHISCHGANDGAASVSASGGVGGYSYVWNTNPLQTGANVNNLPPGNYQVTVTDSNMCTAVAGINIIEPTQINAEIVLFDNVSCNGSADGSATVIGSGGTPPYQYEWSTSPMQTAATAVGLAAGTYTVTVYDINGCDTVASVVITEPGPLTVDLNITLDSIICAGDSTRLNAIVNGGEAPYTYLWWCDQLDCGMNSTSIYNPLVAPPLTTVFYVQVIDANNCVSGIDSVVVNVITDLYVDAGEDVTIYVGDVVQLYAETNNGIVFEWNPETTLSDAFIQDPLAFPDETTVYWVTVIDTFGCHATDSIRITIADGFLIPTAFTPNSDGVNDVWEIGNIELYPNCTVTVYNRWGSVIFESKGYTEKWDGTFNGKQLPDGTYYYMIDFEGELDPLSGTINIMR